MNIRPTTTVDLELWRDFTCAVAKTRGISKGVLKESLEEALEVWTRKRLSGE